MKKDISFSFSFHSSNDTKKIVKDEKDEWKVKKNPL